jgi:hypothetical protein
VERWELDVEHLLVEEQQARQRLVLGAGRDTSHDGQVRQERLDFRSPHVAGMPLVVKEDVAANPVDVGLLGADRVMEQTELVPHLVEQLHRALRRRFQGVGHRSEFPRFRVDDAPSGQIP